MSFEQKLMESENFVANAVGSKTARACDGCIKKRARWYCGADDAFLCQGCDGSIHSANPLAERHQRVRLKTASTMHLSIHVPAWHCGFTKKPRTPRQRKGCRLRNSDMVVRNRQHLVPELIFNNDNSFEENEQEQEQEQLIYQVPIFDDTFGEMSFSGTSSESVTLKFGKDIDEKCKVGFCESDMDLEEFAADVENLLCKGLDDRESFDLETIGFKDLIESSSGEKVMIKFEEDEEMKNGALTNYDMEDEFDMTRETFELNFDDYDTPENIYEEVDDQKFGGVVVINDELKQECEVVEIDHVEEKKSKILLALDYDSVLEAWPEQKSAWLTGDRPEIEVKCWPDCMGECGNLDQNTHSEIRGMRISDGGREARVSRYREKRRSRLFSKKIRYEVRKLNAEKRPRIKGRFVKRENFEAPS